jgi:hypothetical protein
MGLIKNLARYIIKENPVSEDFVTGSDSENGGKTVSFRVGTISGDGGASLQNNRFKVISFGTLETTVGVEPDVSVVVNALLDNSTDYKTVLDDQIPIFEGIIFDGTNSKTIKYVVSNNGKGIYGQNGNITLDKEDLILVEQDFISFIPDVSNDPNANVVNLGEIVNIDFLVNVINESPDTYEIVSGTNWYFDFTIGGSRFLYGFKGANGSYGAGGDTVVLDDLFLIYDESDTSGGALPLQGTTELGAITTIPMTVNTEGTISGLGMSVISDDGALSALGFTAFGVNNLGSISLRNHLGGESALMQNPTSTTPAFFRLPNVAFGTYDLPISVSDGVTTVISDVNGNIDISSLIGSAVNTFATLSGQTITFPDAQTIDVPNAPTGLEALDEGSGFGWRLIGKDPNFYGSLKDGAVDFSTQQFANTDKGATDFNAFAIGINTEASGQYSFSGGFGSFSRGNGSFAFGINADAKELYSIAMGDNSVAYSYSEISIGRFPTSYTPSIPNSYDSTGTDRLFNIGRGAQNNDLLDAFTILRNGNTGIGINNFESNSTGEKLQVSGTVKATAFVGDGSGLTGISGGGDATAVNDDTNNSVLLLDNAIGTNYNVLTGVNTNTDFTLGATKVITGHARVLINVATEPTFPVGVTPEGGQPFQANTDMYMIVWSKGTATADVVYYFIPKAIQTTTVDVKDNGLTGTLDGVNAVFTTSQNYISGTLDIYRAGLMQFLGEDYTETGANEITFVAGNIPVSTDNLIAKYKA